MPPAVTCLGKPTTPESERKTMNARTAGDFDYGAQHARIVN
jgi:hypothetical protein